MSLLILSVKELKEKLVSNFNNDWREITKGSIESQIVSGEDWLKKRWFPPNTLDIPSYYNDTSFQSNDALLLQIDSYRVLDVALAFSLPITINQKERILTVINTILYSWIYTTKIKGFQSKLDLVHHGAGLVDAFWLTKDNLSHADTISHWIEEVYLPTAKSLAMPWYRPWFNWLIWPNNTTAWGWCGYFIAHKALNKNISKIDANKFSKFINSQVDQNTGKMKKEVWRTTSGRWYSYFSLVALTRAAVAISLEHGADCWYKLFPGYNWFGEYCQHPETWPYKPWPWIFGTIEKYLFPCADEAELPSFNGRWPSDLLETIYALGYKRQWIADLLTCPISSGDIFRNSTLLRAHSATKQIYNFYI